MSVQMTEIGGRRVQLTGDEKPAFLIIQPMDLHDLERVESLTKAIREAVKEPFLHCAVEVDDWNRDLSPWPAPPVFGDAAFGDGAPKTLEYVTSSLLPALRERFDLSGVKVILAGYSLSALFALWAGYETDDFDGIAAASPSVWFNGWIDHAGSHEFKAKAASLSLGSKEAKTRNRTMARVADCMEQQVELIRNTPDRKVVFEWNPGNHFKDPDLRTAKAIAALTGLLK